jgi:hypothetical protein
MDLVQSANDHALNAAILDADISSSFEEYLAIVDRFYDDGVHVCGDARPERIVGKGQLISMVQSFLIPLHVMAEVAGLSASLQQAYIPSDRRDEFHSEWKLSVIGATGRQFTLSWSSVRRWEGSRVVYERHYDHRQEGEPLTTLDLNLSLPEPWESPEDRRWKGGKAS